MSNPVEDIVFDYIVNRRPLKLAFIAVAVVGVLSSAYSTLKPLAIALYRPLVRLSGTAPSEEDKWKYGCAFKAGSTSSWLLSEMFESFIDEAKGAILNGDQLSLAKCEATFLLTPSFTYLDAGDWNKSGSYSSQQIQKAIWSTLQSYAAFEGRLAHDDQVAFDLARLGSLLYGDLDRFGNYGRYPSSEETPSANDKVHVEHLAILYKKIGSEFPYRLPTVELRTGNKNDIFEGINTLGTELNKYFGITN